MFDNWDIDEYLSGESTTLDSSNTDSNNESVNGHTEQLQGLMFWKNYRDYLIQHQIIYVPNSADEDSDIDKILYDYETPSRNYFEEQEKEKELKLAALDEERKNQFEKHFEKENANPDSFFHLDGIKFNKFTHKYISFSYLPSVLSEKFVKKDLKFRISLVHKTYGWRLKRMKAPCKDELMNIFHSATINDEELFRVIKEIYSILITAAKKYINIKKIVYERFRAGEEVELFSEDEELFLTPEELKIRKERKQAILQRMLPPKKRRRRVRN